MPTDSEPAERRRRLRTFAIRAFFEAALGLIAVFVLAAMAGPALFNQHSDLALIGAILVWLACPVLLFLLAHHVAGRWRSLNSGPKP